MTCRNQNRFKWYFKCMVWFYWVKRLLPMFLIYNGSLFNEMADNLLNRLNGPPGIWTQYCMTILTRNS